MSKLGKQLEEDRALRDSARMLFLKELEHVRSETTPAALGERIADRVGEKAEHASDAAVDFADRHGKTVLAALAAAASAAGLWLARGPILSGLARLAGKSDKESGESGGTTTGEDAE